MQYNFSIRFFASACLLSALCLAACIKFDEPTQVVGSDARYAFPLFSSSFEIDALLGGALNDTLPGDTLLVDNQGNITLIYSGDVKEIRATNLYSFLTTPFGGPIKFLDTLYYAPFSPPGNVDIKKSILKSGSLLIAGQNDQNQAIIGSVHIPQLTKNGVPFRYDFASPAGGPIISGGEDLNGYTLTSTNDSLFFRYEAYLPDGTRVTLANIGCFISNLTFGYLEGYWGNERFPLDRDTIDIDINQTNFTGGDITIKDPRVIVTVSNSFGFPARGNIKTLQFKGRNGQFYKLESDTITSGGIDFAFPTLQEVGQVKATTFYFDKNNSNIDVIFNAQPIAMDYDVEAIANVLQDPTFCGFMTDTSFIKFNVKVELPLEGTIRNFGAENEVAIDFGSSGGNNSADIASAEFKLVTENGMPVGAKGQIFFLDDQGVVIDSLFSNGLSPLMLPAPVDANGVPTSAAKLEQFIKLTPAQFERIKSAKKARIRTVLESSNMGTQFVKVLSGQKTDIRMGVIVDLKR
jgi:hypothetical protein